MSLSPEHRALMGKMINATLNFADMVSMDQLEAATCLSTVLTITGQALEIEDEEAAQEVGDMGSAALEHYLAVHASLARKPKRAQKVGRA